MFFIALFFIILFALAALFVWLAENPGAVTIEWPWLGSSIEVSLLQAVIGLALLALVATLAWMLVWGVLNSPKSFGRWRSGRRRDKGYSALSKGLVAAGAGNAPLARKLSKESSKLLENEPLVALLDAQTALLEGNKDQARSKFENMLQSEDTKLLGLRGLYVEAEQEGALEAATHFAKEANTLAPGTPWASKAVFKGQTLACEWEAALRTLGINNSAKLVDKDEFTRKRAVLLTALAMEEEDATPERAKGNGLAAHKLAPDLIPAALVAARAAKRLGDPRKAGKVLEASWKIQPHPEVAEEYINLRLGDSPQDRVKRAQTLEKKQPDHFESHYIVAQAALAANDFQTARNSMEKALQSRPSERACLLMADIEEAEHGDMGRMREWLARAVSAPKDATWTADGVVSETWAPFSPVTGKLDAFEWKVPVEQIGGPALSADADYSTLVNAPLPKPKASDEDNEDANDDTADDVDDADMIDVTPNKVETLENEAVEIKVKKNEDAADKSTTAAERTMDAVSMGGSVGAVAAGAAGVAVATVAEELSPTSSDEEKKTDEKPVETASEPQQKPGTESEKTPLSREEQFANQSPFRNANLDKDDDGVIDHRPDDPGVDEDTEPKKKGLFF